MILKINNDFIDYTCDTYATFTADQWLDMVLDGFDENITSDDLEIEYDQKGIVKDIGALVASFLVENFEHIKSVDVTDVFVPRFYNYTTDACELSIDCDFKNILEYCDQYSDIYSEFLQGEAMGYLRVSEEEKALIFYIKNSTTDQMIQDYQSNVYDVLHEIYDENTTITKK